MTDVHSKAVRRKNMQAIKPSDTKAELTIRRLLYAAGYRYRLHLNELPGKPDIILSKHRTVILIHGCFWHGHNCKVGNLPKSKLEYWLPKIGKNLKRDKENVRDLLALQWRVLIIRECIIRGKDRYSGEQLVAAIIKFLNGEDQAAVLQASNN